MQKWIARMKKSPNWDKVNEVFNGLVESVKAKLAEIAPGLRNNFV